MRYIISFWMVAALPSGVVVWLARDSSWVAIVAPALTISRMMSRMRVDVGSPPSERITEFESWKDAASGALKILAVDALHVSVALNVYASRNFELPGGILPVC